MAPEIRHSTRHCSVCRQPKHDIQQRGQDFDKNTLHLAYTVTCVQELELVQNTRSLRLRRQRLVYKRSGLVRGPNE